MINIDKRTVIRVYVTPQDLRDMADEAEKKWATMKLGEDCHFKTLEDGAIQVELVIRHWNMNHDLRGNTQTSVHGVHNQDVVGQ